MEISRKDNGFYTSIVEAALSTCGRTIYRQTQISNEYGIGDGAISDWSLVPPTASRVRPRSLRRLGAKVVSCCNVLAHSEWHFNANSESCEDLHNS